MKRIVVGGCLLLGLVFGAFASGSDFTFEFSGNWEDPSCWKDGVVPANGVKKGLVEVVYSTTAIVSKDVTTMSIHMAHHSDGNLTVTGSETDLSVQDLTLGYSDEKHPADVFGALVVTNGARVTVSKRLAVGHHGCSTTFDLYSGSVTATLFHQNAFHQETGGHKGCTTLHGGVLIADRFALDGGVFDIAGGILKIKDPHHARDVQTYLSTGLMTMNGKKNPLPKVDYTITTEGDYTVIQAVPDNLG